MMINAGNFFYNINDPMAIIVEDNLTFVNTSLGVYDFSNNSIST